MIKSKWIFFVLSLANVLPGQSILDHYIQYGLENNLALQQQNFSCQSAVAALNEARGMFLPSVSVEARYTRAGGGRIIDFPVGDLLNPVYGSLNQLFGAPLFPTDLPNEHIPFLQEKEQETKIRVVQPVFNPAIYYNYQIRSALRDIESLSRDAFARQLVADIQTAYFNYLKTEHVVSLLDQSHELVREHVRVTESLLKNDKVTQADVYRVKAELFGLEQQQAEAEKNRTLSKSYFNFLLNRPLDSQIDKPESPLPIRDIPWTAEEAESLSIQNREELTQLDRAVELMGSKVGLSRGAFLPILTAVIDWGYWDETYRFNNSNDYWTASAVASWNLFNGFQDKYKIDQANLEREEKRSEREAVQNQIRMQAREAWEGVRIAAKSLIAAKEQLLAARKSFDLIDRRYREGMSPQIELLNARNTWTQAEVNAAVCEYDCHIRAAEMEKVAAVRVVKLEK